MSYIKVYLFGIEMLPHHNFFCKDQWKSTN